jgi:formylglycine-generating enzyme
MRMRNRVYMKPGTVRLTIISLLTLLLLWLITSSALTQDSGKKPPIRKAGIINALKELRKGDSQAGIVEEVYQRGVDFELTPAIEKELRAAGATSEMIEAIRANYRPPVPRPTPSPVANASNINRNVISGTPSANVKPVEKKSIISLVSEDAQDVSRVTVTSSDSLSDYSANSSGDRYYVAIPHADVMKSAQSLRDNLHGKGFKDARIEQKGEDLIISFHPQPGYIPRIEQKLNRLDIVFTIRVGVVVRNQIGMELVYVPAGTFMMGSTDAEVQRRIEQEKRKDKHATGWWFKAETPQHQVTIREGFFMGKYEVTQAQWRELMGTSIQQQRDKARASGALDEVGDNYPMYYVSWNDAQEFIKRLNARNDGFTYRLPSEAEWEYAARGGTSTTYFWGENINQACQYANVADWTAKARYSSWDMVDCRDGYTLQAPVGRAQPNNFGLYDMIGNLDEWCEDWYHENYKNGAPTDGSAWISGGRQKERVTRGGSFRESGESLRSASRTGLFTPDLGGLVIGFRLAAVART